MNLYMVIYLAGSINASIGPLPYGIEECRDRAAQHHTLMLKAASTHKDFPFTVDEVRHYMTIECEFHDKRPALGDTQ